LLLVKIGEGAILIACRHNDALNLRCDRSTGLPGFVNVAAFVGKHGL
jgi:hypothetical protein